MKSVKRFAGWQMLLICLVICLGSTILPQVSAQTNRQNEERLPGIPAGYTIIDGDIQMPISVVNAMRQQERQLRSPAAPESLFNLKLWPNGVIPFEYETTCAATSACIGAPLSGCVSAANQAAMRAAMDVLERAANVRFVQCAGNDCPEFVGITLYNYVHIRDTTNDTVIAPAAPGTPPNTCQASAANNSPVGLQGGPQTVNIVNWTGAGGATSFTIIHELMHTLGLFHEQRRQDRDTFVTVASLCNNVRGGCMGNIYKNNFPVEDNAKPYGPYDFDSLMHYGQCDFSVNSSCPATSTLFPDGGITVRVNSPYDTQRSPKGILWPLAIGQRDHLSYMDGVILAALYPQGDVRFVDAANTLIYPYFQNGSFIFPYQRLSSGVRATPQRGTVWIQPATYSDVTTFTKPMTLRAPLGGVTISKRTGAAIGETLSTVSAASYNGELATGSIAATFGENLAAGIAIATSLPLPTTLGSVTVKIKDSAGMERNAPLFFVSPSQVNYQIPAGASVGVAELGVYNGDRLVATGTIPIVLASPGLFSANSSGEGVPAALLLRVRGDAQIYEPLARYDAQQQRFVPVPIDLGPESDQVFLILYGTGFRASGTTGVTVTIGDETSEVLYIGPAPGFAGLDQANVRIPRTLVGKGEVAIQLTADNRSANAVTVNVR